MLFRLKQHLNLPRIEPRPPCPPKVYQRLHQYLDRELQVGTRRSGRGSNTPRRQRSTRTYESPTKRSPHKSQHQTLTARPRISTKPVSEPESPAWVLPVIRKLCKETGAAAAPPHLFAGVLSILEALKRGHDWPDVNLPALIVVLYILVTTRLAGKQSEADQYVQRKANALQIVRDALQQHGREEICTEPDVDASMAQVADHHWTEMDWFNNIRVGSGVDGRVLQDFEMEEEDDDEDDDSDAMRQLREHNVDDSSSSSRPCLLPGLATMLDSNLDYFSEARRKSYERWRADIERQIDEIESKAGSSRVA